MQPDPDQQPSANAAEQRAFAVAKLKRAASLPRMKDGRRPPMHVEGFSEGEKPGSTTPPTEIVVSPTTEYTVIPDTSGPKTPSPGPAEEDVPEPPEEEGTLLREEGPTSPSPGPSSRRRRSRSRSRSRTSRDYKGKNKDGRFATASPALQTGGESSQDESGPIRSRSPFQIPGLHPLVSPIPSHVNELNQARFLLSPVGYSNGGAVSPDPFYYNSGASSPTPMLPSLQAIQQGLQRSNSAGRMMAFRALTGGTEEYSPSPSPVPGTLGRNNTVSGGERSAARKALLNRLGTRIGRETDNEQGSGGEESMTAFLQKRNRRRRKSGSQRGSRGANNPLQSESSHTTQSDAPQAQSSEPIHVLHDDVPPSSQASSGPEVVDDISTQTSEVQQDSPVLPRHHLPDVPTPPLGRPDKPRRRSVFVEDDYDDRPELPHAEELPPPTPRGSPHGEEQRAPQISHAASELSQISMESGVGVPVYMASNERAPSRAQPFPSSPFTIPLNEQQLREDDEQVLYRGDHHRRQFEEPSDREISWIAVPVPSIRMPIDDGDDEDEEEDEEDEGLKDRQDEDDNPPLSSRFSGDYDATNENDTSRRASVSSEYNKEVIVESEPSPSPESTPSLPPASPSSAAPLSQPPGARDSDISESYPRQMTVSPRFNGERSNADPYEWEDQGGSISPKHQRNGTWERVKGAFSRSGSSAGRRSRSNSLVNRDQKDKTDSYISRDSRSSFPSAKLERTESGRPPSTGPYNQSSASLVSKPSLPSLHPTAPARNGASPIPSASPADYTRYQDAKLFPFPGIKKLEEQRNMAKGLSSASSPDVSSPNESEPFSPTHSASYNNTPAQTPDIRERKLSHQLSDSRLLTKFIAAGPNATPQSAFERSFPQTEPFNTGQQPNISPNASTSKLPMTLTGVKQWLSRKAGQPANPTSPYSSPSVAKKASFSDLLKFKKDAEWATDTEEVQSNRSRTTTTSGSTPTGASRPGPLPWDLSRGKSDTTTVTERSDIERTPKAKRTQETIPISSESSFMDFSSSHSPQSPQSPSIPSQSSISSFSPQPTQPISQLRPTLQHYPSSSSSIPTPDPISSLDDNQPRSTTASSSSLSSHYTNNHTPSPNPGALLLDRLQENLARASRSPMWADVIDSPPRKLVMSSPVLQVVNSNVVKDRFLFLFTDILVIAKPVIQDMDHSTKPSPLDRKFVVKSVVPLRQLRFTGDRGLSAGSAPQAFANDPVIKAFVSRFSKDPHQAISDLLQVKKARDDPVALGRLMFHAVELDKVRLGDYLSQRASKIVLRAYIDSLGLRGLRMDKALRAFFSSLVVPMKSSRDYTVVEYFLDALAGRWYTANTGVVTFDKHLTLRLTRALFQLNEVFHADNGPSRRHVSLSDFVEAFRQFDDRRVVSDDLLEDMYHSITQERLRFFCDANFVRPCVPIVVKRPLPSRLTYKVQSEPVVIRIPAADPSLTIHLYGQNLVFDPPVLNFARTPEASFRITGTALGTHNVIMCRSGAHALKYSGLPLASTITVERAFMRHTFQVAFLNHEGLKRRHMFSVEDPVLRHQWTLVLKQQVDASLANTSGSPGSPSRAAEDTAIRVLQETLMYPDNSPDTTSNGALSKLSSFGSNGSLQQTGFWIEDSPQAKGHARSKSRSQLYEQHGAGQLERDLDQSRIVSPDLTTTSVCTQLEGRLWTGRELQLQCQQNSSIPLVLSYLQVWAPDTTI